MLPSEFEEERKGYMWINRRPSLVALVFSVKDEIGQLLGKEGGVEPGGASEVLKVEKELCITHIAGLV